MRASQQKSPNKESGQVTSKSLGLSACTAIVIGNMVGSGFYLSPAAMAPYGNLAILAWVVMGAGAICVGLTFAKLAKLAPATGGPYAYTRIAYGDFAGFTIAWGLWISIWSSLPVIAVAFAGAMMNLFPSLHNRPMAVVLTLAAIWAVVLVNLRGVKEAGLFAQVATYTKLVPFAAIAVVGLFFIDTSNLSEFNPSGELLLSRQRCACTPHNVRFFGAWNQRRFPAGDVIDPKRTIPISTVLGISIAALLYVFGTTAVMGLVPREQLIHSVAPFSDAARVIWGGWGAAVISIAVIISALGALNGWTLLMGQVPMAAARDDLFPPVFARLSQNGVPAIGIVISAIFATLLILSQVAGPPGLKTFYDLVVGLSTMAAVIPYAFCALATGLVAANVAGGGPVPRLGPIEVIAFVFAIFTLYGCGAKAVLYGTIMLVLGIPVYVWQRRRASQTISKA